MKAVGLIFSGAYGGGPEELIRDRSAGSLPFGGRYRQIDFVLSNMVNSGIGDVGVITKYKDQSLMEHLGTCQDWDLNRKRGGLMLIPPFSPGLSGEYRGKLEELRAAIPYLERQSAEWVVLADTAPLLNIDLRRVIAAHAASGKEMTMVAVEAEEDDPLLSELVIDSPDGQRIGGLWLRYAAARGKYTSCGIFVMRREGLIASVNALSARGFTHFERDLIQRGFNRGTLSVGLYRFDRPVLKNRTLAEYYRNNLLLREEAIRDALFRPEAPIYTTVRDEVPSYYGSGSSVSGCLIADGCFIEGRAENSVLFRGVTIGKGATVKNAVIMSGSVIGEGAAVENAVLDKGVSVSAGRRIVGAPQSPAVLRKREAV